MYVCIFVLYVYSKLSSYLFFVIDRNVLNVVVRSAEDLLQISSGLLIDGCLNSEDRADSIGSMQINQSSQGNNCVL